MAVDPSFREFVLEQLGEITPVRARSMFGSVGIYAGGLFFAIISEDTLYFKVDHTNRPDYEAAGMAAFAPYADPSRTLGFYEVPGELLEDPDRLRPWVERAIEAAAGKRRAR